MFAGSPAERPQRVLQAFRQSDEALAAEHDMRMLETGIGQPEMVEPVIEWLACDRDAGGAHVGEIRQSHASGFVDLIGSSFGRTHFHVRKCGISLAAGPFLPVRAIGQGRGIAGLVG